MKYVDEIFKPADGAMGFHSNGSRVRKFASEFMRQCIN